MREGADAFGGFGRLSSFHTLGSQQHLFAFQLKSFSHPRQGCPDGSVPIGCWRQHGRLSPLGLGRAMHFVWTTERSMPTTCSFSMHALRIASSRASLQRLVGVHSPHPRNLEIYVCPHTSCHHLEGWERVHQSCAAVSKSHDHSLRRALQGYYPGRIRDLEVPVTTVCMLAKSHVGT